MRQSASGMGPYSMRIGITVVSDVEVAVKWAHHAVRVASGSGSVNLHQQVSKNLNNKFSTNFQQIFNNKFSTNNFQQQIFNQKIKTKNFRQKN